MNTGAFFNKLTQGLVTYLRQDFSPSRYSPFGQATSWNGVYPLHGRMFSSITSLYSLDVIAPTPGWVVAGSHHLQMMPNIPWEATSLLFENHWFREWIFDFAAAAKSFQSCPTLCDPIDGSPPGSPVPGILQARTLEGVAISFSDAWKWKVKVKSLSRVRLCATPWTAAYQVPPSMGFSRQEYWRGVPLPSSWLHYLLLIRAQTQSGNCSICKSYSVEMQTISPQ